MKKIVILMLALVLALTSVSALAADTKNVTIKYSVPESYEWTAPSEVTLTDAIWDNEGMDYVIEVTLTSARLKDFHVVRFSVPDTVTLSTSESRLFHVGIARTDFVLHDPGESSHFSGFYALPIGSTIDSIAVGDYSGSVTITAQIINLLD